MSSILHVSADPDLTERIERVARDRGARIKSVVSLVHAEQWIQMQNFDLLLVDARFGVRDILKILSAAWKLHPLMIGAVFDHEQKLRGEIELRIQGAHVFTGPSALADLDRTLDLLTDTRGQPGSFHILVVEDLDSPRDIISSYIESIGYHQVEGARSVADALTRLKANPTKYSCIITDINMPEVQGYELIRAIRADEQLMHLPVIVLTAYATPENLMESIRAGATGFLVKPPRKKSLREELEKARRILFNRQSPRICSEDDAELLQDAIYRLSF